MNTNVRVPTIPDMLGFSVYPLSSNCHLTINKDTRDYLSHYRKPIMHPLDQQLVKDVFERGFTHVEVKASFGTIQKDCS